jgi:hypothetical protein
MSFRFVLMLAFGVAVFIVGGLSRTYENIKISQSSVHNWGTWSTELRYMRLVRELGAPLWPLIVASVCIPLGILIGFAAILLS